MRQQIKNNNKLKIKNDKYSKYKITSKNVISKTNTETIYKLDFGLYLLSFNDTINKKGLITRTEDDKIKFFIFQREILDKLKGKKTLVENQKVEIDGHSGVLLNSIKEHTITN